MHGDALSFTKEWRTSDNIKLDFHMFKNNFPTARLLCNAISRVSVVRLEQI